LNVSCMVFRRVLSSGIPFVGLQNSRIMKNIFFSALCIFLFHHLAQAQSPWQLGGFVSEHTFWLYNKTDFSGDHGLRVESSRLNVPDGWSAGLVFSYRLNDWWSVQAEPNFNWQRQKFTICWSPALLCNADSMGAIGTYSASHVITLSYVTLPVHLNFHIPTRQKLGFYVKAGGDLSFLTNYKVEFVDKTWSSTNPDVLVELAHYIMTNRSRYLYREITEASPYEEPGIREETLETDYLYRRMVWGVSGGLGWTYQFDNDAGEIYLGFGGSYSLSRVENREAEIVGTGIPVWGTSPLIYQLTPPSGGDPFTNRPLTHNIRFGLELGGVFTLW